MTTARWKATKVHVVWFDTHCHLDVLTDPKFEIQRARDAGITRFLLPAVSPSNWSVCSQLSRENPDVFLGLGIHPQCVRELSDGEIQNALGRLPDLLHDANAVGELGLDHRFDKDDGARIRQRNCLIEQLDIASELGLPPIIHCLDAHGDFLEIWRNHPCRKNTPGIMHSYSGSAELVSEYVKLNLYISFSGGVTWTTAKRTPKACRATPASRLLIETDAPYQAPHPLEEGPNTPIRLLRIAEVVAELQDMDLATLAQITTQNARELLGV